MRFDVGGRQLYLNQRGHGRPAVIFDAGLGDTSETWGGVPAAVAQFTQACVYDRAGLGRSDAAPPPRTGGQVVDDLHTLLAAAAIAPPYVLVGHSAGGAHLYLYACRYPQEVAGLVLLDPGHAEMLERFRPILSPSLSQTFQDRMCAAYARIEGIDYLATIAEMRAAPPLPDVPLIVVARGQQPAANDLLPGWPIAQTEPLWLDLLTELARHSPQGAFLVAEHSGHYIQRDEPDLVITTIRQVVETARGRIDTR